MLTDAYVQSVDARASFDIRPSSKLVVPCRALPTLASSL